MGLFAILKYIMNHPLNRDNKLAAVFRFFKWQLMSRVNSAPVIHKFTDKALLIVKKGMYGATGNLYCGLHEFTDMGFLLHFLRKEDLFVDIGANIGSYTALAAGHVRAQTISFEPVPATFAHLERNIAVNKMQDIAKAYNMALGGKKGTIEFTSNLDSMNHVATSTDTNKIQVEINTLDDMLGDKRPALLKIDVEGFETEVIAGAIYTLEQKELKAIIIELNGSGSRYGYDEGKLRETLSNTGFEAYQYDPMKRTLAKAGAGLHNTIYIRDISFVEQRLNTAEPFKVLNKSI